MSKERELLARCLEHLEWVTEFPEGDDMEEVAEEIRDYLANANPPEAEPVDISDKSGPTIATMLPNGVAVSNVYEAYEAGLKEGSPSEAEPIGYVEFIEDAGLNFCTLEPTGDYPYQPLYLHPAPRKEFVRLNIEEASALMVRDCDRYELICAVENRLAEKNK